MHPITPSSKIHPAFVVFGEPRVFVSQRDALEYLQRIENPTLLKLPDASAAKIIFDSLRTYSELWAIPSDPLPIQPDDLVDKDVFETYVKPQTATIFPVLGTDLKNVTFILRFGSSTYPNGYVPFIFKLSLLLLLTLSCFSSHLSIIECIWMKMISHSWISKANQIFAWALVTKRSTWLSPMDWEP